MLSMRAGSEVNSVDFVYQIVDTPPPSPLPHALPAGSLDSQDGFVHTSIAGRIGQTADEFFGNHVQISLLKINLKAIREDPDAPGQPRWAESEGCVHIHPIRPGVLPRLGAGIVTSVSECARDREWTWKESMEGLIHEGWLVDKSS
jgi:hypothetical protein